MLYDWFQHIEFKNVWVLPLLLALPVIVWFYYRTGGWRKSAMRVSTTKAFTTRTLKNSFQHLPFWLRLIALACVLLALARPQTKNVENRIKGEGIDIVLCMDISGSMLAADFLPTRLEVSKQMAADFVRKRPVDAIGLVIFSGESFTQFPLSTDHDGLLAQITNLRSGMLIDGTVIGEGLATSVERLTSSKSKSKVIILLTDGNEQPPETRLIDPFTALEIAKTRGVKVYTIGMGVSETSTVEERGGKGKAFLDEALLSKISAETGGQYFRAVDKEGLKEIYDQINRLEKSEVEVVTRTRYEEEFIWLILAALGLLFIEVFLRYLVFRTFP